jgi:Ca2+:H+ antiporter
MNKLKAYQSYLAPILGWSAFAGHHYFHGLFFHLILLAVLIYCVLESVQHAEVIAHRVGEPFGTLLLALCVTAIEVSIIVSLMVSGGPDASGLARDTVYAAVMIILTGMIGISILVGGIRFKEQSFILQGATLSLTVLIPMSVFMFILPNFTISAAGPMYSRPQLIFMALVVLFLYFSFMVVQNFRHRSHFVEEHEKRQHHGERPSTSKSLISFLLLLACLGAIVALAESQSDELESYLDRVKAPRGLVGVILAFITLLPEGLSAYRAARKNELQRSLNLALGSALASLGLTLPIISLLAAALNMPLMLGIGAMSMLLFMLTITVIMLSLATGKTTIMQGLVLVVIMFVCLFVMLFP